MRVWAQPLQNNWHYVVIFALIGIIRRSPLIVFPYRKLNIIVIWVSAFVIGVGFEKRALHLFQLRLRDISGTVLFVITDVEQCVIFSKNDSLQALSNCCFPLWQCAQAFASQYPTCSWLQIYSFEDAAKLTGGHHTPCFGVYTRESALLGKQQYVGVLKEDSLLFAALLLLLRNSSWLLYHYSTELRKNWCCLCGCDIQRFCNQPDCAEAARCSRYSEHFG